MDADAAASDISEREAGVFGMTPNVRRMKSFRRSDCASGVTLGFADRGKVVLALLSLLVAIALILSAQASASDVDAAPSTLRFQVVKRTTAHVVLRRSSVRLVLRRWDRVARVEGIPRYLVVKYATTYCLLRRLPAPAADPVAAINNARAGALIVVGPGKFSGRVFLPSDVSVIGFGSTSSWLQGPLLFRSHDFVAGLKIGDIGETAVQNLPGAADTTFSDCRFRGGRPGRRYDTVILGNGSSSCRRIAFKYCQVERNLGEGDNIFIGENGSAPSGGAHVDSVVFEHCHVGVSNGAGGHDTGSPRAGLEAYTYPTAESNVAYHGWSNLRIINCVFEATDGFCLDLSDAPLVLDPTQRAAGPALVSGCTLKGGGYPSSTNGCGTAGYTLEIEAPKGIVIRRNTIYRGHDNAIQTGASNGLPSGLTFRDNVINIDVDNGISITNDRYQIVLGGTDHEFIGNTVINHVSDFAGPYGVVTLDRATGCVMTGNLFRIGVRRPFIEINGSSRNTLSPNKIR